MELHEIIKILERIAPPELAEPWDNNGLQIDVGNNDIKKIMFTMEINEEIIDEAIETYKKFQNNMKTPLWIDRVLRDFRYVDCNLLYQTIEKLGIE